MSSLNLSPGARNTIQNQGSDFFLGASTSNSSVIPVSTPSNSARWLLSPSSSSSTPPTYAFHLESSYNDCLSASSTTGSSTPTLSLTDCSSEDGVVSWKVLPVFNSPTTSDSVPEGYVIGFMSSGRSWLLETDNTGSQIGLGMNEVVDLSKENVMASGGSGLSADFMWSFSGFSGGGPGPVFLSSTSTPSSTPSSTSSALSTSSSSYPTTSPTGVTTVTTGLTTTIVPVVTTIDSGSSSSGIPQTTSSTTSAMISSPASSAASPSPSSAAARSIHQRHHHQHQITSLQGLLVLAGYCFCAIAGGIQASW